MLGLDQTALLLDALRPPPGMEIDAAVGTTFTLDLAALLAVPVAASFGEQGEREDSADLLETIRRYADRTVLFCQAGAISVPAYRAALTFVEQTVVEVGKPKGGIFHPKMWVVRFSGRGTLRHRVLVMSRNLTFDRAWDVLVRLDDDPDCAVAVDPRAIIRFVDDVAGAAVRPLADGQRDLLGSLRGSLAGARLAVPVPFTAGAFVAVSPRRRGMSLPFHKRCDHALAISPFLTTKAASGFLDTASQWSGVVSRGAALDSVANTMDGVDSVLRIKDEMLDAQASVDHVFEGGDETTDDTSAAMRGLHAKVYVQDTGGVSTVWLGSANLTDAAFSRNWEALVKLTGPRRQVGYDVVLTPKPQTGNLSWLVERHEFESETFDVDDSELPTLDGHAYELASRDITVALTGNDDCWAAELLITPWELPDGVAVSARLLSQRDSMRVEGGTAVWDALALHQITPFVVLELQANGVTRRVLVRADLDGDDHEQRRGAVLADAISNRGDFLRYLAALLGLPFGASLAMGDGEGQFDSWTGGHGSDRVLEDLLTTASRQPHRLVSLEQTLRRLEDDKASSGIVPADFRALWQAVHTAQKGAIR